MGSSAHGFPLLPRQENSREPISVELIGLCTDIGVIVNAVLLKTAMPEIEVSVDASCCAGVTPEKHEAALEVMRSCQIVTFASIRSSNIIFYLPYMRSGK